MKNLIVLLVLLSSFSFAEEARADRKIVMLEDVPITSQVIEKNIKSKAERDMQIKNCEAFSVFAKSSFKARQNGVGAAQMFKTISDDSQPAKQIMELIVADVFKRPLLGASKQVDITASEYANSFFIDCTST